MRASATAVFLSIACLLAACEDDPVTPEPPDPAPPSTWSEWRDLPPSSTTYALWAESPTNAFAVGPAGTAYRWNGTRWSRIEVALLRDLWSVTGIPGGPVVAVGDRGATFRFDGLRFEEMPRVTTENLRSVWAASPDTMLVVGEGDRLLIGDGATWSLRAAPARRSLFSIWGTSASDVFAVGVEGTIAHFDGASWNEQQSGTTQTLASVSGTAPDDVYAVGTLGTILHYDGSAWSPMTSTTTDVLQCVVADGGNPIAVGANGTALQLQNDAWSRIDFATTHWLYAVARTGANTWVAGAHELRVHDGDEWTSTAPGTVPILQGVCTDVDGTVVVVGEDGYIARGRGEGWDAYDGVDAFTLHAVHCTRSGELFAAGTQRILHFNGAEWVVELEDIVTWYAFGESPTDLFIVGSSGAMRRRSGTSWVPVAKPALHETLRGIASVSSNEAYAVGASGMALRYDGVAWTILPTRVFGDWYDVIENLHGGIYRAIAVGQSGTLLGLNAIGTCALESPTSANLYALALATNGDILAFGGAGALMRFDGTGWAVEPSPALQPLYGAWSKGSEVFVVGGGVAGGLVLRYGPP